MRLNRTNIHLLLYSIAVCLLVFGFLCSRVLLSIGTILFIVPAFLQGNFKERFNNYKSDQLSLGISCLFLLPFLSGLWSSHTEEWAALMQDKLPLLLLPFAFIQLKGIERKQLVWFKLFWMAALFTGSLWSVSRYVLEWRYFNEAYRFSQTIPTPAANDHIRFSMAIIIALLFWLQLEQWKLPYSKWCRTFIRAVALWFIVYLHILGAKTGLLGFYLVVFPLVLIQLYQAGRQQLLGIISVAGLCLPLLAYTLLPTFRMRLQYVLFESQNWTSQEFAGRFSDGNRWASIQSGWYVFQQNWLTGAGYGDIKTEAAVWYNNHAPAIAATERFLPLNQWLLSGSGAGIVAVLLFTFVAFLPFFLPQWKQQKQARGFVLFMNLVFLYESTIDDQFGVFLYSFFILYWHYTINHEKIQEKKCSPSLL